MDQNSIMQQLVNHQKLLKMTAVEVSQKSGVPINTYYNMKCGRQYNSFNTIESVANTLGLELVLTIKRE